MKLLPICFSYSQRTMGRANCARFDVLWLFSHIGGFSWPWYIQHRWRVSEQNQVKIFRIFKATLSLYRSRPVLIKS